MANYSDETTYPVTTPEMSDTTMGTDKSAAGNPQVTFIWSAVFTAASAEGQNIQTAQRASANGADPVDSITSAGVLNLHGFESQSGALSIAVDGVRDTININPVFGTAPNTVAEGSAPPAVQANLDVHTGTLDIHYPLNDSTTTTTNLWSASKINTDLGLKADQTALNGHTANLGIHRNLNDSSSNTTELLSSAEIDSRIAASAGVGLADNPTWTGNHVFEKPITISDGASLTATIGIDQTNTAIRIEVPASSNVSQVIVNKLNDGGNNQINTRFDGPVTMEDSGIPGDN